MEREIPFSIVLLAGGSGSRMESTIPKQYLPLRNKPLVLYSFELFLTLTGVVEIVVVCDPTYQHLFEAELSPIPISFAIPGPRRQDSVFNGIQNLSTDSLVCIHDSARPLIDLNSIYHVVKAADQWGAAALGVPVKGTIKVCDGARIVIDTPERSSLWEMQTPQVVRLDLIRRGFSEAQDRNVTVTDDVSLVELIGHPVKVVQGSYTNIKVTTSEDLILVEHLLDKHVLLQADNRL
jgi:2-C-methyl-D-erythritol 4-phosphate cytidylyltransferase